MLIRPSWCTVPSQLRLSCVPLIVVSQRRRPSSATCVLNASQRTPGRGSSASTTTAARPIEVVDVARLAGPQLPTTGHMAYQTLLGSVAVGIVLGFLGPVDEALPESVQRISAALGWSYFSAWSLSFYPQVTITAAVLGQSSKSLTWVRASANTLSALPQDNCSSTIFPLFAPTFWLQVSTVLQPYLCESLAALIQ